MQEWQRASDQGTPLDRMDLGYLLDQLEEVLSGGTRVPLSSRTLVDEQEVLDILDQIRVAVPEEIKAAKRLNQERDEILDQAQAEADLLVRDANRELESRLDEHELILRARERAADIEDDAHRAADQVRREADDYAIRVLQKLRGQVANLDQAVARALREMTGDDEE
jgi:cell division septum initiation protein DivIVA